MNKLLLLTVTVAALAVGNVSAAYVNVTTNDGHTGYDKTEDQEMDCGTWNPWTEKNQSEEVEAFMWDASTYTLSLVGGYDFENGYVDPGFTNRGNIRSGDIFVDLGQNGSNDLAINFDFVNGKYDVYEVTASNIVNVDTAWDHNFANPFEVNGGTIVGTGILTYNQYSTDVYGLLGGFHNEVVLEGLDKVGMTTGFDLHYTMACGNDLITGSVPEPAMLTLVGFGIFGMAFIGRKRR